MRVARGTCGDGSTGRLRGAMLSGSCGTVFSGSCVRSAMFAARGVRGRLLSASRFCRPLWPTRVCSGLCRLCAGPTLLEPLAAGPHHELPAVDELRSPHGLSLHVDAAMPDILVAGPATADDLLRLSGGSAVLVFGRMAVPGLAYLSFGRRGRSLQLSIVRPGAKRVCTDDGSCSVRGGDAGRGSARSLGSPVLPQLSDFAGCPVGLRGAVYVGCSGHTERNTAAVADAGAAGRSTPDVGAYRSPGFDGDVAWNVAPQLPAADPDSRRAARRGYWAEERGPQRRARGAAGPRSRSAGPAAIGAHRAEPLGSAGQVREPHRARLALRPDRVAREGRRRRSAARGRRHARSAVTGSSRREDRVAA